MRTDFLFVFILGLIWTGIAITVTLARQSDCSIRKFYFSGSIWATLVLGIMVLVNGDFHCNSSAWLTALGVLATASLLNGLGQAVMMYNLQSGGCALAYAIPQLAFLVPFLWSGLFGGEKISFLNIIGIVVVAVAIVVSMSGKNDDSQKVKMKPRRIIISLVSMLILGSSQVFMIYPSLPQNAEIKLSPTLSAFVILLTSTICFGLVILTNKSQHKANMKKVISYGVAWGSLATASYLTLFFTLKLLGSHGQAGIVFPIGCSTSIVLFAFFTRFKLKEHLCKRQIAAIAAIIVCIFLIKLG